MIRCIAKVFIGLFAGTTVSWSMAATVPAATVDGAHWQIEAATAFRDNATLAAQRNEQILVWEGGNGAQAAESVLLLVHAPYDEVQPLVQKALGSQGAFDTDVDKSPLAYLPDGWDQVLLSRRPDLRNALADRFALPRLQLAVAQGVLTPSEMEQRLARARASVESVPQDRDAIDAFRVTYANWSATRKTSYGLAGKRNSALHIAVFDFAAMFGHPATMVEISRFDSYPNPNAGVLKQLTHFNVLSSPPSRYVGDSIVPAPVFLAVSQALAGIPGGVEIARAPSDWVQPVPQATTPPPLVLSTPAHDAPVIQAQAMHWDALVTGPRSLLYPHDLLTLPDGDVLFSAEVSDDSGWLQHVWRLHETDSKWKVEEVWRGAEGARELSLSADGHIVWFDGAAARNAARQLMAYDVQARHVAAHAVTWADAEKDDLKNPAWELAGNQLPAIFTHDYRSASDGDKPNPLGYQFLTVWRPSTLPSAKDAAWSFKAAFSSARQSMMSPRMKGNTLIRPVRWRDAKTFWMEDQTGIAELDASSGRVLRALAMPQRFGAFDPADASGVAEWVPTTLGSPEAGWIATGFVLTDDGRIPSVPKGTHDNGRLVGMHVINLKDGRVLSALLGHSDTLEAAARSAHGRWLALGSNGPRHSGPRVVLWDVGQANTPVRLDASPSHSDVHALAFSWDGKDLWALGDSELFRWSLPESLRDGAGQGSFPDQSRRR